MMICFIIAMIAFVLAIIQFAEKGFLFNNAYLWASKEERERMDKKPYYRQSGVVFLLVGLIFWLNGIALRSKGSWILPTVIAVEIGTVIYAVVSSILIEKKK